ncbi:MAG: F0F1 ATP synthase subunit delta [Gammaproteobacteria bacterium]|nr:F0F1 ATP synthase subunit delta [Gammaproteobacteria bacterium]
MAGTSSLARPYARAVFELAQEAGDLKSWSEALAFLAALVSDESIQGLINNPRIEQESLQALFDDLCGDRVPEGGRNLVRLMMANDRLLLMPDVASQYERLRAEAEGSVDAEVRSAKPMSDEQQAQLAKALEKRLGRKVNITVHEDDSLLGGAIVRAGDLVIDGSAKGRLEKLASALQR